MAWQAGHAETRATCGVRRKQQGNYPAICCHVRQEPREPERAELYNCNLDTRVDSTLCMWCHFYVMVNFFPFSPCHAVKCANYVLFLFQLPAAVYFISFAHLIFTEFHLHSGHTPRCR